MRTTVYAIRDATTKERLTYRYRSEDIGELYDMIRTKRFSSTGRAVEIYRTTQDLPRR